MAAEEEEEEGQLTGLRLCDQQKGREKRHLVRESQISTSKHHTHQQQNFEPPATEAEGGSDAALSWMSGASGTQSPTIEVCHECIIKHSLGNIL